MIFFGSGSFEELLMLADTSNTDCYKDATKTAMATSGNEARKFN